MPYFNSGGNYLRGGQYGPAYSNRTERLRSFASWFARTQSDDPATKIMMSYFFKRPRAPRYVAMRYARTAESWKRLARSAGL